MGDEMQEDAFSADEITRLDLLVREQRAEVTLVCCHLCCNFMVCNRLFFWLTITIYNHQYLYTTLSIYTASM